MKGKKVASSAPVAPELLDSFVLSMIEALKEADDPYAVAEVEHLLITPPLEELLLFVGISSKQSGTRALFAWTEAIKTPGGFNDSQETS